MSPGLDFNTDVMVRKLSYAALEEKDIPWKYGPRRDNVLGDCYSLMYIWQVSYYHCVEGRERIFIPAHSLVLRKFHRNIYVNTSANLPIQYSRFVFHTLEEIPIDFSRRDCFVLSAEAAPQCEEKITAMLHLYTERPFGWKTRLRGIAEELLLSILKVYYEEKSEPLPPLIHESTAVIRRRIFSEVLSVDEVARECGVTPAHLIRSFRRYLDVTPKQYMNSLRVEMACDLLKYTGKSMEEIAEQSGFSEARQMRRVFRETVGVTPREYREQT